MSEKRCGGGRVFGVGSEADGTPITVPCPGCPDCSPPADAGEDARVVEVADGSYRVVSDGRVLARVDTFDPYSPEARRVAETCAAALRQRGEEALDLLRRLVEWDANEDVVGEPPDRLGRLIAAARDILRDPAGGGE